MKILEINKYNFPQGGADRHFLDVSALLRDAGHAVAIFAMRHPKNMASEWEKYFVSTVGYTAEFSLWQKIKGLGRMFYSWEARRKIEQLLNDFQPDIVHVHNIYHQLSPSILPVIKKRQIPIIMTVHDFKLICPDYLLRGENYSFWKFIAQRCFKNSFGKSLLVALEWHWHKLLKIYERNIDLYLAPSKFVQDKLIQHGIQKDKILILPHFIPNPNTKNTTLLYSNVVFSEKKYALYCGRISKEKGADRLIEIFANTQGIKLCLAGAVEEGFEIKETANIKYLGFLSPAELREKIQQAEVIVSGSRLPETFGLVALEAIAAGKPFVGFDTGAYGEIIHAGVNGFLVNSDAEFIKRVRQLASREIVLDAEKITETAQKKFNTMDYLHQLEKLIQACYTEMIMS